MRKTLNLLTFLLLLMMATSACNKDDPEENDNFFYSIQGEKVYLKVRKDKVIIKAESADEALKLQDNAVFLSAEAVPVYWVLATIDSLKTNLDDLLQITGVADAAYGMVYPEYPEDGFAYPSDKIFVQCKGQSIEKIIKQAGLSNKVEDIELFSPYSEMYLITFKNVKLSEMLNTSKKLFKTGKCNFAAPSFFRQEKLY